MTPPSNIWSCNGILSPTRCKAPQNAAKRRKTPQNAAKRRKRPQNTVNMLAVVANLPENARKFRKTPQNATKRHKKPKKAKKSKKTPQILRVGDKSLRDQIFGGAKKPTPFAGLLKLIVDHNWGGQGPLPPLKTLFLVSSCRTMRLLCVLT